MADILKAVGGRIKEIRKSRGLSQDQLAEKSGFHFSYVGGVERGERNVSLENLAKIADALHVPVRELLHFDDSLSEEKDKAQDEVIAILDTLDIKKIQMFKKVLIEITSSYAEKDS
ncbi:helix-turn-helix domain-containing protein [Paenibacillus koleovorans]|uniref:helix-turn-helix domain-containing protein n=1 Tax=Paenibacillus koleovorans TaxID=121608 RepID=UPI000FDC30BD|nr:helix-turn-helix transcriptional regulator [Paenibacillus koleovorans]